MKESLIRRCSIVFIMMAAAFAMCAAMVTPAFAANTPVNGGTFNFNKYLVMDANANVPNATFDYTISSDGVTEVNGNPSVYKGIGNPSIGSAIFSPTVGTTNGEPNDNGTPTAGRKYATQEVM